MIINSPNYNEGLVICNYVKIKYIDQQIHDSLISTNNYTLFKKNPLDLVFQPSAFNQQFNNSDSFKLSVYSDNIYINYLDSIGIDFLAKVGFAKDVGNTILFWFISNRNTKPRFKISAPSLSISSESTNKYSHFTEYIIDKIFPDVLTEKNVSINGNNVQLLKENQKNRTFFKKQNNINYNTEYYALILSNSEFNNIISLANLNFSNVFKPYLCFSSDDFFTDDIGNPILKQTLTLKGVSEDTNGNLEILEIPTGVVVYSQQ